MDMGKTNERNFREDETFAEAVKYQCLQDKSFPGYGAIYTCQFEGIHFVKEIRPSIGTLSLRDTL